MAIGLYKIIKGLLIKEEGTLTPAELEILPSGSAGTKTTLESSQTSSRIVILPDADTTLVGDDNTVALTNKTIDADLNTITGIGNAEIETGANIARNKLASGTANRVVVNDGSGVLSDSTITTTELGYLDNVTSDIQSQIDSKASTTDLNNHINDTSDAHDASAISNVPSGNLVATDVQAALNELQSDIDTRATTTALNDHINDTSDAHDASAISNVPSGNLAATDVQAALNELQSDVDTRVLASAPAITDPLLMDEEASTPSTPASGKFKLYPKSDGKLYTLNDDGTETQVGSGAGGINYMSGNPDAESSTTGYATYADAAGSVPVDGTGGSPNVTWTRSTSSPLRGTASFLLTKDAANRQGQGVSYDFTIASADQAKPLQIGFEWAVASGTFAGSVTPGTNSDVTVHIYDVTNGLLIEPSGKLLEQAVSGQSYRYRSTFQTSSNSTSYRLILHVATTSASAYTLKFDNFSVGPQVISNGAVVSDWVSYTPTSSWVSGVGTLIGRWRRVGDQMEIQAFVPITGAVTAANFNLSLPSGYVIDNTKVSAASAGALGTSWSYDASTATGYNGTVIYNNTTSVRIWGSLNTNPYSNTVPFTWANTDEINLICKVPIVGWSSNVQMSNDTDTRVVAATINNGAGASQAITGTSSKITYNTTAFDSHGAYDPTTNYRYTIPVSGTYVFSGVLNTSSPASDASFQALLYKNGSAIRTQVFALGSGVAGGVSFSFQDNAVAGDYYEIFANSSVNLNVLTGATYFGGSRLDIKRLSGPSQIAASESVGMSATTGAGPSFTSLVASTIIFNSKSIDTHNTLNISTGVYTIPVSGLYRISAMAQIDTAASAAAFNCRLDIRVNSSVIKRGILRHFGSTTSPVQPRATTVRKLNAGDTVDIQLLQDSGSTLALTTDGTFHDFSIERVGV